MEYRQLGRTGLTVSALGLGTMELRYLDEPSAGNLLNAALDGGISFIDTSPEYPMAEYYIGQTIAHRRDEYVLATKCGDDMTGMGAQRYIFDRRTIASNLEESLRLMKTDHVDVLQLHGVIPELLPGGAYGEAMEAMREARRAGKALHLGLTVCNRGPGQYGYPATYGYNSILRFAPWEDVEVIQLVYGALTRISENVIQKAYDAHQTGIVARGIMKYYDETYAQRVQIARLAELTEEGEDNGDFLIRYALSHPALACGLIGTKSLIHLRDDIRAVDKGALDGNVYQEAKSRLTFAGAIAGPVDMKLDW